MCARAAAARAHARRAINSTGQSNKTEAALLVDDAIRHIGRQHPGVDLSGVLTRQADAYDSDQVEEVPVTEPASTLEPSSTLAPGSLAINELDLGTGTNVGTGAGGSSNDSAGKSKALLIGLMSAGVVAGVAVVVAVGVLAFRRRHAAKAVAPAPEVAAPTRVEAWA